MKRHNSIPKFSYPTIEESSEESKRPFWSVMIPTYNPGTYLEATLKSVLDQGIGYDEMQIEVIDDCSDQDIYGIVQKVGNGRIGFHRQTKRGGQSINWNTCIQRARGHWVHILNHDDIVLDGFYQCYKNFIERNKESVFVFCRAIAIDERGEWMNIMHSPPNEDKSGNLKDAYHELCKGNFIVSSSTVVCSRDVFVKVGGFSPDLHFCTDWNMWIRIARHGSIGYISRPYCLYRFHSGSDTERLHESLKDVKEIIRVIDELSQTVPASDSQQLRSASCKRATIYINYVRMKLHNRKNHKDALKYALWLMKLNPSPRNFLRVIKSIIRNLAPNDK